MGMFEIDAELCERTINGISFVFGLLFHSLYENREPRK